MADPRTTIAIVNDASDAIEEARALVLAVHFLMQDADDELGNSVMAVASHAIQMLKKASDGLAIAANEMRAGTREGARK